MKNLIFFFLLLISEYSYPQTNIYHPFPSSSNAMWRVDWADNNFCNTVDRVYQYYYDGDTTINAVTYHKIGKSGIILGNCYTGTPFGYQGALREDTTNRKVYLVWPGTSSDSLLYDFSLNVGDTLRSLLLTSIFLCSNSAYPDTVIVTSIDSVLVGNSYRKRWNFDMTLNCQFFPIIEGVGSVMGLIEDLGAFEQGGSLVCFTTDSLSFINYLSPFGCNVIDQLSGVHLLKYFDVSPNPFTESIDLSFLKPSGEKAELKIFDMTGKLVFRKNILLENQEINLPELANGVYLLQLTGRSGVYVTKIIK